MIGHLPLNGNMSFAAAIPRPSLPLGRNGSGALICRKIQRICAANRNFATLSAVHKKVQGGLCVDRRVDAVGSARCYDRDN